MKEAHLIVQGKGGVGKSFTAMIIAQYLAAEAKNEVPVVCFDTDPVNQTFSRYASLKPEIINILTADNTIDTRMFDGLIEKLIETDGIAVVDNGAATFVPLMSYMAENHVDELLKRKRCASDSPCADYGRASIGRLRCRFISNHQCHRCRCCCLVE